MPFPVVRSRISQCYRINDSCNCECNLICITMPNQQHSNLFIYLFILFLFFLQMTNNTHKQIKLQICLPHPQTKMAHCPQCDQNYNTKGMTQVRHNVRERSPKLEWQTLDLKNIWKTEQNGHTGSNNKENNEGFLPQALSLKFSAGLSPRDDDHSE